MKRTKMKEKKEGEVQKEAGLTGFIKKHSQVVVMLLGFAGLFGINFYNTSDLRQDIRELRQDIREVRQESSQNYKALDQKIDENYRALNQRIDKLYERIDGVNQRIDGLYKLISEKKNKEK